MCSKNKNYYFTYLLIICLLVKVYSNNIDNNPQNKNEMVFVEDAKQESVQKLDEPIKVSDEVFVPTNEWQTVKKDQAIPKGLHVRINLQTGEREAKLLDEKDAQKQSQGSKINVESDRKMMFSKELEDALKKLNDDSTNSGQEAPKLSEEELKIKSKFRSYEKLKEELGEMNLNVKTDGEQITDLLARFNTSTDKLELINILKDLEDLVHKYDNGILLCDMKGFEMIMKLLNSTDDIDLKKESVMVLGAAIQSNPKVKIHAIKSEFLQLILNKLAIKSVPNQEATSSSSNSPTSILENDDFHSKLLFTLSGLLREYPFAQNQFIRFGGINILSNLIETTSSFKVKLKIITLTNDLIQEKHNVLNSNTPLSNAIKDDYKTINLIEELEKKNFCQHYEKIMDNLLDHDSREKIFNSMLNLVKICHFKWSSNKNIVNKLIEYRKFYKDLYENDKKTNNEDHDDYYIQLSNIVNEILAEFKLKEEL